LSYSRWIPSAAKHALTLTLTLSPSPNPSPSPSPNQVGAFCREHVPGPPPQLSSLDLEPSWREHAEAHSMQTLP
jgi:hypothetical protein